MSWHALLQPTRDNLIPNVCWLKLKLQLELKLKLFGRNVALLFAWCRLFPVYFSFPFFFVPLAILQASLLFVFTAPVAAKLKLKLLTKTFSSELLTQTPNTKFPNSKTTKASAPLPPKTQNQRLKQLYLRDIGIECCAIHWLIIHWEHRQNKLAKLFWALKLKLCYRVQVVSWLNLNLCCKFCAKSGNLKRQVRLLLSQARIWRVVLCRSSRLADSTFLDRDRQL